MATTGGVICSKGWNSSHLSGPGWWSCRCLSGALMGLPNSARFLWVVPKVGNFLRELRFSHRRIWTLFCSRTWQHVVWYIQYMLRFRKHVNKNLPDYTASHPRREYSCWSKIPINGTGTSTVLALVASRQSVLSHGSLVVYITTAVSTA